MYESGQWARARLCASVLVGSLGLGIKVYVQGGTWVEIEKYIEIGGKRLKAYCRAWALNVFPCFEVFLSSPGPFQGSSLRCLFLPHKKRHNCRCYDTHHQAADSRLHHIALQVEIAFCLFLGSLSMLYGVGNDIIEKFGRNDGMGLPLSRRGEDGHHYRDQ